MKPNVLDEAGATPTLDAFFDREPDELTDAELDQLVAAMRAEREAHETRERKKQAKKDGD